MNEKIFYKYKSFTDEKGKDISKYFFDSLINKYFYFSSTSQLNDPLDCKVLNEYEADDADIQSWIDTRSSKRFLTVEKIRNQLKEGRFQQYMEECARRDEKYFHVLSLTDSWQNKHMWENYAQKYEGICLGYKSTFADEFNDYIKVEEISADVPIIAESFRSVNGKAYFELQKVQYDNDGKHKYNIFKSNDKTNIDNIAYALFHKTKKWEKENEYRKIIIEKQELNESSASNPKDLRIFYPDDILSEINFGYKCNSKMQDLIINYIKRYYSNWQEIQLYSVKLSESGNCLLREKI